MAPILPQSAPRQGPGTVSLHSQGVRRRSSQIVPPPNAFVEIRVGDDEDEDDSDDYDEDAPPKATDALIPRRSSSTSATPTPAAFQSRRVSTGAFTGLFPIGEKCDAPPLTGSYLLYTSVFITVMLGPQLGWEISQLNLRAFHNSKDCAQRPVPPGKCIVFPGHSDIEWVAAVMCWVLGAALGSLLANIPAEKYGRRCVVVANAAVMILGGALQTFAPNIAVFALGRLFSGVASGSGSTITSLFLGEIGPPHQRAGFVIAFQCTGSTGLVASTAVHFAVTGSPTSWRWVMAFPIALGAAQLLLAPLLLVESPKWLLQQHRPKDAARAFHALYRLGSFQELERAVKAENERRRRRELAAKPSFWQDALSPRCRRQFRIACILCAARQLGGVSAVFYYSSGIFAGAGIDDSRVGNLALALVNLLSVFVVCVCSKRLARRRMLLAGVAGMVLCSVGMTVTLVFELTASIAFTALYVACNSLSLSPLPFLVTAEVLPEDIKARGISVTTFVNWVGNLLVGSTFPVLVHYAGSYTFVPFTGLLLVFWVCIFALLPETKDKTNEQIQQEFADRGGFFASFKKFKKIDEEGEEEEKAADGAEVSGGKAAGAEAAPQTPPTGAATAHLHHSQPARGPRRTSVEFVMPAMAPAVSTSSRTA
ncbi:hypothetical protein PybrP1_005252 [[Pythium] brassicae (nom. inval.)]|nr:hypothetical protein PybrP1_005252 [[Pythium] brassicae (nom. inval.)]